MTHFGTGHVVTPARRPGYVRVAYVIQADFKGAVPEWVIDLAIKRRCRSLLDIDVFVREDRLSQTPFLAFSEVASLTSRSHCYVCQHKFGVFRKKTSCFKCGQVCCRACNPRWNVRVSGMLTQVEACAKCTMATSRPSKRELSLARWESASTFDDDDMSNYSETIIGRPDVSQTKYSGQELWETTLETTRAIVANSTFHHR